MGKVDNKGENNMKLSKPRNQEVILDLFYKRNNYRRIHRLVPRALGRFPIVLTGVRCKEGEIWQKI
jgi:hypothetical protein